MIKFTPEAWEQYQFWLSNDKKIAKKINELIKATLKDSCHGIGKPEPLKHELQGFWSRRINKEHRFVYKVENNELIIISCRFHYSD